MDPPQRVHALPNRRSTNERMEARYNKTHMSNVIKLSTKVRPWICAPEPAGISVRQRLSRRAYASTFRVVSRQDLVSK